MGVMRNQWCKVFLVSKREIEIWDVFWHKNCAWQRKVISIQDNWDIWYNNGIWFWYCSRWHFMQICPEKIDISQKDIDIARKLSDWRYEIYEDTKNWTIV